MNRRQLNKAFKQLSKSLTTRAQLIDWMAGLDKLEFDLIASTPNGSARLQAIYQAVTDVDDTLEAVGSAIYDGDLTEAQRLISLGSDSLAEHIAELKGLL